MAERKNFGEVFEGRAVGVGTPLTTLRRVDDENTPGGFANAVGVFHGATLVALIDFDDIFDEEGNRFHND